VTSSFLLPGAESEAVSESTVSPRLCPHPDYETVTCPACRSEIRGVVPTGSTGDPAAQCPACDAIIESVILPD